MHVCRAAGSGQLTAIADWDLLEVAVGAGGLSWAGLDRAQLQSLCVHERKSEREREGGREGGGECASVNAEQQ